MIEKHQLRPLSWFLLFGMALSIPCLAATVLNNCLTKWPLYPHSRMAYCVLTLLMALLFFILRKMIHSSTFRLTTKVLVIAAAGFFCVQLICASMLRHTPFTDTEQIVTAAVNLARTGKFETSPRSYQYFSWYPFNLGTVYLYAFLFKVLGFIGITDHYMIIAVFAGLLFAAGLVCGAKAADSISGGQAALLFLVLCALTFPFYYCTAELYTDVLALPFPMIVLYLFRRARATVSKTRYIYHILFALFSLFGFIIRVTTLIVPVACLISALFEKRFRLFFICLVLTCLSLLVGGFAMESANERHLGKENLRVHRLPVWHYLAMGLPVHEDEGYGQYGDGGWLILSTSFDDPEARDARLKQEIWDRLYYIRYPSRMANMFSRKNVSTFGDGTFHLNQLIEADEHEITNALKTVIYAGGSEFTFYFHLCTAIFYAQMILAGVTCVQAAASRFTEPAPVFISLVGAFIYLTFWETNARYFFMFEFLLLLAASIRVPSRVPRRPRQRK